ncbi:MAG: TetR/AcrR family transcriptional regulator C-terminal domain-containing protein, partial [Ruminococcus sp.]|nr:TetR/AcrR family transcriptional regulator C-terminal domain-containing protein [Ruminococcus sp.]
MTNLTKDAIKKSFMKLLNAKPVNKITVKEIVADCGINRNSFYYHFDDIPSLIEEILNEQADALVQTTDRDTSIYTDILTAMDFALQNKTAMLHLYNSVNKDMFERYLNRIAHRTVTEYFEVHYADEHLAEDDKQVVIMYYKSL